MKQVFVFISGAALGIVTLLAAQNLTSKNDASFHPYEGQDSRIISSFSRKDIDALEAGDGWGLAKPAELNGFPGPAHVLEFASQLELSDEQYKLIKATFDQMKQDAKRLGTDLIEAEKAIDDVFRNGAASASELSSKLENAERIRAMLRAIHLKAHLKTTPQLTVNQRQKYAKLRGYEGHSKSHQWH